MHAVESMAGAPAATWPRPFRTVPRLAEQVRRSTLRKRVFVLAPESARVQLVAGPRERDGNDKRT
ncbi:hypothetical protein GCM10010378_17280 [Streptomyces viridochromogenes]